MFPTRHAVAKNQMQLALALSSSLEESSKQELSKKTEELPACSIEELPASSIEELPASSIEELPASSIEELPASSIEELPASSIEELPASSIEELPASSIEDGSVPQNIKQMQKECFEQLQEPKPGPSKKGKNLLKPAPSLLGQNSGKQLRIVIEKVALVFIRGDTNMPSITDGTNQKVPEDQQVECRPCQDETGIIDVPSQFSSHGTSNSPSSNQETVCMNPDFQSCIDLQNDWQRMLIGETSSDVRIIVKEKVVFKVHKVVLNARCPLIVVDLDVTNTIHWSTVPYIQAFAFLEYLYCGKLSRVSALGEDLKGVIYLAEKYKLTYILNFISRSGLSIAGDNDTSVTNSLEAIMNHKEVLPNNKETNNTNAASDVDSWNSSDFQLKLTDEEEEGGLVNEFIGTSNPTVCSPTSTLKSDYEQRSETLTSSSCCIAGESSQQNNVNEPLPSTSKSTEEPSSSSTFRGQKDLSDSDEPDDIFSSPVQNAPSIQDSLPSSSKGTKDNQCSLAEKNIMFIIISSDDEKEEANPMHEKIRLEPSTPTIPLSSQVDANYSPTVSSQQTHRSVYHPSGRMSSDTKRPHSLRNYEEAENTSISSTPLPRKKKLKPRRVREQSSLLKRRRSSSPSSSDTSLCKYSARSEQNAGKSFSCITKPSDKGKTKRYSKVLHREEKNHFSLQRSSSNLSACITGDDNERDLLQQTSSLHTPKSNPQQQNRLRTPLDNVKTSSPVTPMPNYDAMTDKELEVELQKYGLKRRLSRSKGIQMLTHIYGSLHPSVEVVSRGGQDIFIPLQELAHLGELLEDDQLSPQSTSSSDNTMLEETIFDEEELSTDVSSNDVRTCIKSWITSQAQDREKILSYQPVWLDCLHQKIKGKSDRRIKVNDLMNALDEQCISFQTVQGYRERLRRLSCPKETGKKKNKKHGSKNKVIRCKVLHIGRRKNQN